MNVLWKVIFKLCIKFVSDESKQCKIVSECATEINVFCPLRVFLFFLWRALLLFPISLFSIESRFYRLIVSEIERKGGLITSVERAVSSFQSHSIKCATRTRQKDKPQVDDDGKCDFSHFFFATRSRGWDSWHGELNWNLNWNSSISSTKNVASPRRRFGTAKQPKLNVKRRKMCISKLTERVSNRVSSAKTR